MFESSEIISNISRFQGQYFDQETGLHYNRYRYYSPYVGRFISRDPIKLSGGSNIYA
nr:RHS repeat-associated core domain-containing protein [Acinetobacter sp. ANC 3832]